MSKYVIYNESTSLKHLKIKIIFYYYDVES